MSPVEAPREGAPANPQKHRTGLTRLWHATGYSLAGLKAGWAEKAFRQEALDAWEHFQSTGLHVTGAEADAWLAELEAGNDVEPPRAHI